MRAKTLKSVRKQNYRQPLPIPPMAPPQPISFNLGPIPAQLGPLSTSICWSKPRPKAMAHSFSFFFLSLPLGSLSFLFKLAASSPFFLPFVYSKWPALASSSLVAFIEPKGWVHGWRNMAGSMLGLGQWRQQKLTWDLVGVWVHTRGSRELMHGDLKGQLELSQQWQKKHGLAAGYSSRWAGEKEKKERKWAIALGLSLGQKMEMESGPSWVEIGLRLKEMGLGDAMGGMGKGCLQLCFRTLFDVLALIFSTNVRSMQC